MVDHLNFYKGDISNENEIKGAFIDVTKVIHQAALGIVRDSLLINLLIHMLQMLQVLLMY